MLRMLSSLCLQRSLSEKEVSKMSQVVTMRLPDNTAEIVRRIAQRERRSLSDVSAWMIEEWVRENQFAHIEFRSFQGERQACIKERLQVWQVIQVAKSYALEIVQTAAHLGLEAEQVQAALHYYEAYPDEIDQSIATNEAVNFEQVKRLLPNARLSEPTVIMPMETE